LRPEAVEEVYTAQAVSDCRGPRRRSRLPRGPERS